MRIMRLSVLHLYEAPGAARVSSETLNTYAKAHLGPNRGVWDAPEKTEIGRLTRWAPFELTGGSY